MRNSFFLSSIIIVLLKVERISFSKVNISKWDNYLMLILKKDSI